MFQSRMRSGMALIMAMLLLCATSLVHAAADTYATTRRSEDLAAETLLVDGLVLRPMGVLATIAGSMAFVVTLPFSIPTKSVNRAAQRLVVDPAQYTFVRPLGQIESPKPPVR